MSILDLSKSLIYDFHYNYTKIKYGYKTLSLMKLGPTIFTQISTPTLRNGLTLVTIRLIIHLELKQDLKAKCLEHLRMKRVGSRLLNLLAWWIYSYKMLDGAEDKTYKGVTKNVTKTSIQFDDYRQCLFSRKEQHRKLNVTRSQCHVICTEEINKISLSSDDDKRVIMAAEYTPWLTDIQS